MLEGLYSAAAGMSAQQEQLDAIGNDLANVSTTGYQSERVAFSDLLYNAVDDGRHRHEHRRRRKRAGDRPQPNAGTDPGNRRPARPGDRRRRLLPGQARRRHSRRSPATAASASTPAARSSTPKATSSNRRSSCRPGSPPSEVKIGTRRHRDRRQAHARPDQARHRRLARPSARGRQRRADADRRQRRDRTRRRARQDPPGRAEGSNVDMPKEMALMVSTQRAYQMSSTAIQTESQMMSIANQLRPS